jgi:hypothetical protein
MLGAGHRCGQRPAIQMTGDGAMNVAKRCLSFAKSSSDS